MKKKMAIILSVALACSSMTAMAAPSPSIKNETVQQVVVSPSTGSFGGTTEQAVSAASGRTAVLPGTTFKTAGGQVVDAASVAIVTTAATAEQAQAAAASLSAALTSDAAKVLNFTGVTGLSLTDSQGRLNIVNNITIGLATATGEAVSQNGSLSATFTVSDILGGGVLNAGETIQALYQRADGTWVAVPVVIIDGVAAVALPAFGGAVNVTFVVAKGTPMSTIPTATSPRT